MLLSVPAAIEKSVNTDFDISSKVKEKKRKVGYFQLNQQHSNKRKQQPRNSLVGLDNVSKLPANKKMAVAISPSTAICPWNLFCRDHSRVFI